MNEAAETVHVVFGRSIADTLRDALAGLGCAQRVIGLPGVLSIGPIDPPGAAQSLWAEATAPGIAPVFWACLTSPMEHACYLAFAAHMHGRPFEIVDATNLAFTTADGVASPCSLGLMRVQDIVASNLISQRRAVSAEARLAASARWAQLRRENAPFRIVRDGQLVSAPLTAYDGFLVDHASQDWEIAARLIGRVITALCFADTPPGHATTDTALFGRLRALADAGALEITGPGPGMRDYQVRRPMA